MNPKGRAPRAIPVGIYIRPLVKEKNEFWSGQAAVIDRKRCTQCELCQDVCRFDAISGSRVDPISCEGCGFCSHICPVEAITMN